MTTTPDPIRQLQAALTTSITEQPADVLLLSGGVDSSLLAAMAKEHLRTAPVVITVSLDTPSGTPCPTHGADLIVPCNSDHDAACDVIAWLDMKWQPIRIPQDVALHALLDLCVTLRSFDLGNLNNIPLYVAALRVTRFGAERIWTGDDADSLFGGYRFLGQHEDWRQYIEGRIPTIRPPFTDIAAIVGATPIYPWLHPHVLDVARTLERASVFTDVSIEEHPAPPSFVDQFDPAVVHAGTRTWGKAPVRRIASELLPDEIAWRPKIDLQFGSGMCALEAALARTVTPDDRDRLDRTGIRFVNDAHRGLYLRYIEAGGDIPSPQAGEYACVSCGGGVVQGRSHCPTCGAWPANWR